MHNSYAVELYPVSYCGDEFCVIIHSLFCSPPHPLFGLRLKFQTDTIFIHVSKTEQGTGSFVGT